MVTLEHLSQGLLTNTFLILTSHVSVVNSPLISLFHSKETHKIHNEFHVVRMSQDETDASNEDGEGE